MLNNSKIIVMSNFWDFFISIVVRILLIPFPFRQAATAWHKKSTKITTSPAPSLCRFPNPAVCLTEMRNVSYRQVKLHHSFLMMKVQLIS